MKKYLTFTLFVFLSSICNNVYGQYVSHYTEKDKIKIDTLIDKKNGNKFIIDKQRIYITAIDKNGKLLWKTDPVIDNKIEKYRNDRPTIIYFALNSEKFKKKKEIIWIYYSNTQFGFLEKSTGKFSFQGQD